MFVRTITNYFSMADHDLNLFSMNACTMYMYMYKKVAYRDYCVFFRVHVHVVGFPGQLMIIHVHDNVHVHVHVQCTCTCT